MNERTPTRVDSGRRQRAANGGSENDWWRLSVASLETHLPADWEATCAGVDEESAGDSKPGGVRVNGPDGTAYRLYGCEWLGYRLRAGVMDGGPVVNLDSEGAVTHRRVPEPTDFETALRIIVRKAQVYASGGERR